MISIPETKRLLQALIDSIDSLEKLREVYEYKGLCEALLVASYPAKIIAQTMLERIESAQTRLEKK